MKPEASYILTAGYPKKMGLGKGDNNSLKKTLEKKGCLSIGCLSQIVKSPEIGVDFW